MKMFAMLVVSAGLVSAASPAAAQQAGQTDQVRFATAESGQPPRQGDTPIELRGQVGGLFCCSDAGFILGGGFGARPFNNRQVEVTGDVSFLRFRGANGVYASGNGLYHFKTSDPKFSPYAGGGIGIVHSPGDTEARFQILGGMEFDSSGRHPIRPEVRFIFTEHDATTVLLVSIGLGKR